MAVCVPAYGDASGLRRLLISILAQDHPGALEVVVAIDGPDEALEQVARDAGAVVVVLPVNRGSYAARNAAIAALGPEARAVLFTDIDVVLPPHWVTAHLDTLEDADMSGGDVRFRLSDRPTPAEWVDAHRHLQQRHYVESLGYAATCNLAVRREVLEAVRFAEQLRSGGDFQFGQAARQAGFSIAFSEDAWIEHEPRRSTSMVLRKVDRVAKGASRLEADGFRAIDRRLARSGAVTAAREQGIRRGSLWFGRVFVVEQLCRLAYARRVPSVVIPALRRRLTRRAA